ncbi:hypothetical protein [Parasediminibacterium sp. JCM 36343]|uniref:hypothetical protein n=1 Tax=Parasediminibacterium sp. JCM 36343 TaxID=3374279 RepID=UPI00397AD5AE
MRKYELIIILLVCFFAVNSYGQDIQYDFKNPDTIKGILPYDLPFRIHFLNIDSQKVKQIIVNIYQVDITNYHGILNDVGYKNVHSASKTLRIITNNDVLNFSKNPIIALDTIFYGIDFSSTDAYTKSFITLKPSVGYFIEVKILDQQQLNDAAKKELIAKIEQDTKTESMINDFAKKNINERNTNLDISNKVIAASFVKNVSVIIKATNKKYAVANIDSVNIKLKSAFGEMFKTLSIISGYINTYQQRFNKDTVFKKSKKFVNDSSMINSYILKIKNDLLAQNWFNLNKDSNLVVKFQNEFKPIKKYIDSVDNTIFISSNFAGIKELDAENWDSLINVVITEKSNAINTIIEKIIVDNVVLENALATTYPKEFVKQANQFITSTAGYSYVWGIGRWMPYLGIHISPSPLNDSTPLRQYKGFGNFLRSRFSLLIGMSLESVAKDSVRRGVLLSDKALILGTGFRLWTWLKINSGFYFYYTEPKNPLLDRNNLTAKASPFVSFSIDVRVQSLLNGIGNSIFRTN